MTGPTGESPTSPADPKHRQDDYRNGQRAQRRSTSRRRFREDREGHVGPSTGATNAWTDRGESVYLLDEKDLPGVTADEVSERHIPRACADLAF
jgi:hypothetical protein